MKYIVCERPGKLTLKEKDLPKRLDGNALIKIRKVGICGTDYHAYAGDQAYFTYPRILGHELAGEIYEIEENGSGLSSKDKVIIMPYLSCGRCVACRSGKSNCCVEMQVLGVHIDGGMQEIINVPVSALLAGGKLSDEEMVVVEPLAIGEHAIRRSGMKFDETIVVMGCGPIGIGIMKLAKIYGARVIALDKNITRLQYAKDIMGVDFALNVDKDAQGEVYEITQGDMATTVFDATGQKGALEAGPKYLAHGGMYVLVGLSKGGITFQHPEIHAKEASIICSRNATVEDFLRVMDVLGKGKFPVHSYITHNVKFTNMTEYIEKWIKPQSGVMKATVEF